MSHIKDLIVNGVTRVLGKLIANEITTSSIKAISNQSGTKYFATNGTVQQLAFIPGGGEYSAISDPSNQAGNYAVAEGQSTIASGDSSHAEGFGTVAEGPSSHAEGVSTHANGEASHAEGFGTVAEGPSSHAEGVSTHANGEASHAGGFDTIASGYCQTAIGACNTEGPGLFIVGNGQNSSARTNAFRVGEDGVIFSMGPYETGGADYAEYFEWEDGNPNNEDRIGHFVALSGKGKIKIATSGDKIIGVVSGNASVVGNAFEDTWSGIYLHDVYGRPIKEEIEEERVTGVDEDGNEVKETVKRTVLKVNPDYDPNQTYIPRSQRPEWDIIGLLGQLIVIDDGTCQVGGRCSCNDQGIATAGDKYDVIKRLDDTHVVLLTSFLK